MKIAAILPHLEVFGGVRRYIEIGNIFIRKRHSFTIYHPAGSPPGWLPFSGQTKPIEQVTLEENDIAMCSHHTVVPYLERANSKKKIFYCGAERRNIREGCKDPDLLIMGNSTGMCEMIRRKYKRECIEAIGGINPELFHPVETKKDNQQIKILCYGRLYKRRKGIQKVIKAAELLYKKYRCLRLLLFDTPAGNPRIDARKLVHTKVPVTFYFCLPQEKMAELYSQADIFVSAEKRGGWSNPCAEAIACKIPVVCSTSGTRDFAIDGETALVFHWRHPFIIARKIRRLIEDKDLRLRIAEKGYEKIQQYTWSNLVDKLEREFEKLLLSG